MFIDYYSLFVIVYVRATNVATCDVIIKFHVINSCYRYLNKSETLEEKTSPVL